MALRTWAGVARFGWPKRPWHKSHARPDRWRAPVRRARASLAQPSVIRSLLLARLAASGFEKVVSSTCDVRSALARWTARCKRLRSSCRSRPDPDTRAGPLPGAVSTPRRALRRVQKQPPTGRRGRPSAALELFHAVDCAETPQGIGMRKWIQRSGRPALRHDPATFRAVAKSRSAPPAASSGRAANNPIDAQPHRRSEPRQASPARNADVQQLIVREAGEWSRWTATGSGGSLVIGRLRCKRVAPGSAPRFHSGPTGMAAGSLMWHQACAALPRR